MKYFFQTSRLVDLISSFVLTQESLDDISLNHLQFIKVDSGEKLGSGKHFPRSLVVRLVSLA